MKTVVVFFKDYVDGNKSKSYRVFAVEWEDGVLSLGLSDATQDGITSPWGEAVHIPLNSIQYWTQKQ